MAGKPTGIKILKNNFENALKMAGISKIKLAAASGVQLRKLQKNVNQTGRMSYDDLITICKVINTDPRYIMESEFEDYKRWCNVDSLSRDPFTGDIRPGWIEENKTRLDPDGIYIQRFRDYSSENAFTDYAQKLYEALNAYLMQFDFFSLRSDAERSEIINELANAASLAIQAKTDDLAELYSLDNDEDS